MKLLQRDAAKERTRDQRRAARSVAGARTLTSRPWSTAAAASASRRWPAARAGGARRLSRKVVAPPSASRAARLARRQRVLHSLPVRKRLHHDRAAVHVLRAQHASARSSRPRLRVSLAPAGARLRDCDQQALVVPLQRVEIRVQRGVVARRGGGSGDEARQRVQPRAARGRRDVRCRRGRRDARRARGYERTAAAVRARRRRLRRGAATRSARRGVPSRQPRAARSWLQARRHGVGRRARGWR